MRPRPTLPSALVCFTLAVGASACAGAAKPDPVASVVVVGETSARAPTDVAPDGAVIVWVEDASARFRIASVWLEAPAVGRGKPVEVARRNEPVVVTKGGLVALRPVDTHAPLASCDACATTGCAPSGELSDEVGLEAVGLVDGTKRTLSHEGDGPRSVTDAVSDFESAVEIRGAVGATLFFRTSGSGMGCGAAHPYFFASAEVVDLDDGSKKALALPRRVADAVPAQAKRAIVEQQGDCLLDPEETPSLFEVTPEIGGGGELTAAYTMTMSAPYVCGVGPGHYSADATIGGQPPPDALIPVHVPAWLGATLAKTPTNGLGLVGPGERDALLAAFRSSGG